MTKDDDKWVREVAWKIYRPIAHTAIDQADLIQEGRIALWQLLLNTPDASSELRLITVRRAITEFVVKEATPETHEQQFVCKRQPLLDAFEHLSPSVFETLDLAVAGNSIPEIAEARGVVARRVLAALRHARTELQELVPELSDLDVWITNLRQELDCSVHGCQPSRSIM